MRSRTSGLVGVGSLPISIAPASSAWADSSRSGRCRAVPDGLAGDHVLARLSVAYGSGRRRHLSPGVTAILRAADNGVGAVGRCEARKRCGMSGGGADRDISLLFDVFVVHQRVRALLAQALSGSELRADEYAVYSVLFERGSLTPTQLAACMAMPVTTTLDYVRVMMRRGHVRRARNPADGRSYTVSLTMEGLSAHRHTNAAWNVAVRRQVQPPALVGHDERPAALPVDPFQLREGQRRRARSRRAGLPGPRHRGVPGNRRRACCQRQHAPRQRGPAGPAGPARDAHTRQTCTGPC
jgi:DNA-binding MarR family transcriptional regulator